MDINGFSLNQTRSAIEILILTLDEECACKQRNVSAFQQKVDNEF